MSTTLFIVITLVLSAILLPLGWKYYYKPIEIRYHHSYSDDFCVSAILYFLVTGVLLLDLYCGLKVSATNEESQLLDVVISRLVIGGILLFVLMFIASIITMVLLYRFDMDYGKGFDANAIKFIYSAIIFIDIVVFIILILKYEMSDATICIVDRIVMWIITVAGTWGGIGFCWKNRLIREKEKNRKIYETTEIKKKKAQEKWNYIWPKAATIIAIGIMMCILATGIPLAVKLVFQIEMMVMILSIVVFCEFLICKFISNPGKWHSDLIVEGAVKRCVNDKEPKTFCYRAIRYQLLKDKVHIFARNVKYVGHEQEIENLFGEHDINVDYKQFEEIKGELASLYAKQQEYLRNSFNECRENARNGMLENDEAM